MIRSQPFGDLEGRLEVVPGARQISLKDQRISKLAEAGAEEPLHGCAGGVVRGQPFGDLEGLLEAISRAGQVPHCDQHAPELHSRNGPVPIILGLRQGLLCCVACLRQAAGFLVEPPQLDPAPGVVGICGLSRFVKRDHLGGPHFAAILAVLGEGGDLAPAGGGRFRLGLLNRDQGGEAFVADLAIPFGKAFQGFAPARVRRVGDRGDLAAVVLDLCGELAVAGGDFVHKALALGGDRGQLGLRRLAGGLLRPQAAVLGGKLREELLFPLVREALDSGDRRRAVEHEPLDERPVLGGAVGWGHRGLSRSGQEAGREERHKEDRGPQSVLPSVPGTGRPR